MTKFNIELELEQIGLIFAKAEFSLMEGERIYYSQRNMLFSILKQLPEEGKSYIAKGYPKTFEAIAMRWRRVSSYV